MSNDERLWPNHLRLAKRIGRQILSGDIAPGALLPTEIELAQDLGISRSVVREALRALHAKGLIDSRRRAGTSVRDRQHWNMLDADLLGWMFEDAPPLSFVSDLFQLRLILEPAAAALAATHRSAAQLERMGQNLERMVQHGLATAEGQAADQEFHAIILQATGNDVLASLSTTIAAAVRWTTFFKYQSSRKPRDPMPQHRLLFAAIAQSDAAAARAATEALVRQALADTEQALAG